MIQWLRSALFVGQIYVMMPVIGLLFLPYAAVSRQGARAGCKAFSRWVFWSMRWMVGIRAEIRGDIPQGEVLICAKHQSFLDIMMIFTALPQAKFIMKKEILWTPVIGLYAWRLNCVAVDRGKRGAAIEKMLRDVREGKSEPGQLIIYSQGTRVAPGDKKPYKVGSHALYAQLDQPAVPVATNVGLFWPRKGIIRRPGVAVCEFLEPMAPGMDKHEFMAALEERVETASNALMREGGFEPESPSRCSYGSEP